MVKSFYAEPIYRSDFGCKDLQAVEKSIQTLLEKNSGVGVVGGYYEDGLPVCLISELALLALGCHDGEAFGNDHAKHFADRFLAEDAALAQCENFRAYCGKRTLCLRTFDGKSRWFSLCKNDEQLADGRVMWLLTLCDCDELHRHEQSLIEARNSAEAANRAKSTFLSRMSHDIRTPLNGILGMARIAQEHADDPETVRRTLAKLASAGEQLETLINDVLDMSRLESGRIELLHQRFDLYELLARNGDALQAQSNRMQLTRNVHFNNTHNIVYGSPLHIQRVIANISSNAIKYNRVGGTIDYTLDELPQDATHAVYRFTIKDTGVGMSEEFLQHIYEPFAREGDAADGFKSTGLGMAITKELVDCMGGTITATSKLGQGTKFVVELPLEIDPDATAQPGEAAETLPDLHGMRILLAEDNALSSEIAQYLLHGAGAEITAVENGQQAVAAFAASGQGGKPAFDAILMDIMMPEMDGLAAARAIRTGSHPQAQSIPIIAQTANAFAEDVKQAIDAGMNDHVAKPLDEARLRRVLAKYRK